MYPPQEPGLQNQIQTNPTHQLRVTLPNPSSYPFPSPPPPQPFPTNQHKKEKNKRKNTEEKKRGSSPPHPSSHLRPLKGPLLTKLTELLRGQDKGLLPRSAAGRAESEGVP